VLLNAEKMPAGDRPVLAPGVTFINFVGAAQGGAGKISGSGFCPISITV